MKVEDFRRKDFKLAALGAHKPILQSMLDFEYLCGHETASLKGVVTPGSRTLKLFWGEKEVLIPCYRDISEAASSLREVDGMLNLNSGRRCYQSTKEFFEHFPSAWFGHTFAEDMPEQHALDLYSTFQKNGKTLIGPAGVGPLVPGYLKLGAIGGTELHQITDNRLMQPGNVAVLSASGGMVNELITIVSRAGKYLSLALCFGGDRFPYTTPREAFLAAQADPKTEAVVYYGELGGEDEYELTELIQSGQINKPVLAYIAGTIGETFSEPVQFGHAKALARTKDETASAKRKALQAAGATVAFSIEELVEKVGELNVSAVSSEQPTSLDGSRRTSSLFSSTVSQESEEGYKFAGKTLPEWAEQGDIAAVIVSALTGRGESGKLLTDFTREVVLLGFDHGPQVSGAVNTAITARAGKNLVDSLAAGLLTIGPRFGGAITGAARIWFDAVKNDTDAKKLVEEYARNKQYIAGIGHKKYRLSMPDPRVARLENFVSQIDRHPHYDFAKKVEAITTNKKGNLILNFDGHISAILLDILLHEENMPSSEVDRAIDNDFFNAYFVIPRVIGFTAHYLDQKHLDEGLFRLPDDGVSYQE